ncbi:MAG: hypothetical protein LBD60_03830 [Puniceicoccales bacterium]|jgi:chromosome segregation ATPase|nr:hypothetical protein [Puniceicoccales bacterium]
MGRFALLPTKQEEWENKAKLEIKKELIKEKNDSKQAQDQLALEIMSSKENLIRYNQEISDKEEELKRFDAIQKRLNRYKKEAISTEEEIKSEGKTDEEITRLKERLSELDKLIANREQALQRLVSFEKEVSVCKQQILILEEQIEEKGTTYKKQYEKEVQDYEMRFGRDLRARIDVGLKTKIDVVRNRYVIEKFYEANAAMRAEIGQSYPEPILRELAQFTADCLSLKSNQIADDSLFVDPGQCPTAEGGYKKIINPLLFSDWSSGQ